MLKFKLGQIIRYAHCKEEIIRQALKEFFGDKIPGPEEPMYEQINALFNEWLIFDFRLSNKMNLATDYLFKNPDSLDRSLLDELEQILKTQFYDLLEIAEIERGRWLKLYSFTKGKIIKIWDKIGSTNAPEKGTLTGRPAKIRGRWYLVGSNGLQLPLFSTSRHKKIIRQAKNSFKFTPKDALVILLNKNSSNEKNQRIYTKKEIKNKRKKLEKKFNQLAQKHGYQIDFQKIVEFIYNEDYHSNHADMFKDLIKLGIPEKVVFNSVQLLQDIWNFFPHKSLKGKCPVEMYQETYLR